MACLERLIAVEKSAEAKRRAVELAGATADRDDASTAGALLALAEVAWRQGRVGGTLDLLRAAKYADEEYSGDGTRCYPGLGLSTVLGALGEFDDAEAFVIDAADAIALRGDAIRSAAPAVFAARVAMAAGRLEAATAAAQAALELTIEFDTPLLAPIARDVLITSALLTGQVLEAANHLSHWCPDPTVGRLPFGTRSRQWAELRVRDAQGGSMRAEGPTGWVFDLLATDHRLVLEESAAPAWLVRAARRVDDQWLTRAVVETAERLAVVNAGYPTVVAAAAHARGVMDGDRELLIKAADGHRSPWARASAAEDVGVLSADHGGGADARSWFEQAAAGYSECGATTDHARIRARLRTLGVRRRHWTQHTRPVSGWESLTETELAVAALVAEGLSNQQVGKRMFLSHHTVDFHLRQIFRKLGIDSRVVLTRIALTRVEVAS
jgi:DNA-binding CsgD family transcriptional regulator